MNTPVASGIAEATPPRRPVLRVVFLLALLGAFTGFVALGLWQVQRMAWKHDLIGRVTARINAEPAAIPARGRWDTVDAAGDEYRRVRIEGRFLDVPPTRVQAVTELGPGWWLLSPFENADGDIVFVNRGYATSDQAATLPPPASPGTVTGLLRLSEPGGAFLRQNAPAEDRWHSRDVPAIAEARTLPASRVAPFFIDADHATSPGPEAGTPVGGLTVVQFRDSHLSYALTWFGMALLTLLAIARLVVIEWRFRQHRAMSGQEPRDANAAQGR